MQMSKIHFTPAFLDRSFLNFERQQQQSLLPQVDHFSSDIEIAVLVQEQFCESRWLAALVGVPAGSTTPQLGGSRALLKERDISYRGLLLCWVIGDSSYPFERSKVLYTHSAYSLLYHLYILLHPFEPEDILVFAIRGCWPKG